MASIFTGTWIEVLSVREVHTLSAVPEELGLLPEFAEWKPTTVSTLATLVEFKFSPASGKLPNWAVGEATSEFAEWVRSAAASSVLNTTRGVIFSGIMIGHIGFTLGKATSIFPWAGGFEPRILGTWVAHSQGAAPQEGMQLFLPENF